MEEKELITYIEITEFSPEVADTVRRLVTQLDDGFQPLSDEDIRSIIVSPTTHLIFARDAGNTTVGMLTLVVYRIPYKMKAWIEDVVVDEGARGKGIGTGLMEEAIRLAKRLHLKAIDLTSRPMRESANTLYQRLGFEKRDTNVYRLTIE